MKYGARKMEERLITEAATVADNDRLWWGQGELAGRLVLPPVSRRFRDYGEQSYYRWLWLVLQTDVSESAYLVVFDPRVDAFGVAQSCAGRLPQFFGFTGSLVSALSDLYEARPSGLPPVATRPMDENSCRPGRAVSASISWPDLAAPAWAVVAFWHYGSTSTRPRHHTMTMKYRGMNRRKVLQNAL